MTSTTGQCTCSGASPNSSMMSSSARSTTSCSKRSPCGASAAKHSDPMSPLQLYLSTSNNCSADNAGLETAQCAQMTTSSTRFLYNLPDHHRVSVAEQQGNCVMSNDKREFAALSTDDEYCNDNVFLPVQRCDAMDPGCSLMTREGISPSLQL